MRNLLRAGCLFAAVVLSSCGGDSSDREAGSGTSGKSAPGTGAPGTGTSTSPLQQQAVVLSTESTGLVQTVSAKGIAVQLDGRFQSAVMARRNSDGSISVECHDEHDAAEAFIQGNPAATAQGEVK
jgi:hypothetical protein